MRSSLLLYSASTLLLVTACNKGLSEESKILLLASLDDALTTSAQSDEARKKAVTAFGEAQSVPKTPCTVDVLKTGGALDGKYGNTSTVIVRGLPLNMIFDEPAKPAKDGWRHTKVSERIAMLRRQVTGEVKAGESALRADSVAWAKSQIAELADLEKGRYELGVFDRVLETVEFNGEQYPSRVAVRVYAWDHQDQKIVCSAEHVEDLKGQVEVTYREHEGMQDADVASALRTTALNDGLFEACAAMGVGAPVAAGK